MSRLAAFGRAATGFLFPCYAGMVAGVSFLATMAKFQARRPTMAQLVEIGSITFHWFHAVELILVVALLAASAASRSRWRVVAAVALALVWGAQEWWLFPILDRGAEAIVAGGAPAMDNSHMVYAGFETFKLLVLIAAGIAASAARPARSGAGRA